MSAEKTFVINEQWQADMLKHLRRMIVRAAPTCTLWRLDFSLDAYRFVLQPKWTVAAIEIVEAG